MRDKLWQMEAVVFDTDGVITDTAGVHSEAWKEMFDEYLEEHSRATGEPFRPFTEEDYLRYVDGKPRYDGVRSFLQSRDITLPEGSSDDPPSAESVRGLGNRKNERFLQVLRDQGAVPYQTTIALIEELHSRDIATAVISSSRNCEAVLEAAGVRSLFAVKVDGIDSAQLGLAGKPDPAIFLEATRRLGIEPGRAVVVEDALSGVEAGRRGGFGLVVGVDRGDQADQLAAHGADVVVSDLGELLPGPS